MTDISKKQGSSFSTLTIHTSVVLTWHQLIHRLHPFISCKLTCGSFVITMWMEGDDQNIWCGYKRL